MRIAGNNGPVFEKNLRLAGVMQYTHVVLEYWGTLRYDCLKELAWPQAFDKTFAKDMAREIREMGMEAIPMLNHLGHASACRVSGGKHVVLDQNPRLAPLFSPDGWSWNAESSKVQELLAAVRRELYDIYPDAKYIHLGCDEVYSYERGEEDQRKMRVFMTALLAQVSAEGKTPMIWGDMLLNAENVGIVGDKERYHCADRRSSEYPKADRCHSQRYRDRGLAIQQSHRAGEDQSVFKRQRLQGYRSPLAQGSQLSGPCRYYSRRSFGGSDAHHMAHAGRKDAAYRNVRLDVRRLSVAVVRPPEIQDQNRNCRPAPKSVLRAGGLSGIGLERSAAVFAGTPHGLTVLRNICSKQIMIPCIGE